jgi:hypothetical protein
MTRNRKKDVPAFVLIIRAIWERGEKQAQALAELEARGLWLSPEQKRQAGIDEAAQ